jgi:hypothetical protein
MMVPLHAYCDAAGPDGFLRAPLDASKTQLAMIQPGRSVVLHCDIVHGTDPLADPASVAGFTGMEGKGLPPFQHHLCE